MDTIQNSIWKMQQSAAELGKGLKMFGIGEMTQSNAKGNFQKNFLRKKKKEEEEERRRK